MLLYFCLVPKTLSYKRAWRGRVLITRGLNMGAKDIMEKTLEGYNDVFADARK